MRTLEDPTRDLASEARDDHASEPRATPETDALVPSQSRIRTMREYIDELEAHARRLERQRDELMEACKECNDAFGKFYPDPDSRYGMAWATVKAAIAAVKGGTR